MFKRDPNVQAVVEKIGEGVSGLAYQLYLPGSKELGKFFVVSGVESNFRLKGK